MLNRSGRAVGKGGALYWSYNPSTKQFYTIGAYSDGTISLAGRNYSIPVWTKNGLDGVTQSSTATRMPHMLALVGTPMAACLCRSITPGDASDTTTLVFSTVLFIVL